MVDIDCVVFEFLLYIIRINPLLCDSESACHWQDYLLNQEVTLLPATPAGFVSS